MTNKVVAPINSMVPGQNLDAYISSCSAISILTADEERALAERLYYEEDVEAARQLVMSHLRFVVHIARSYSGYGLPQADLIQEGNVGLMKAVRRFNPEMGVRLVSFAVHWIKAEMHEYILRNWRIVKVATTKSQRKMFFNLRGQKKKLAWFSAAEVNSVAEELGVTPEVVRQMEGRLTSIDMSFDGYDDDDEGPSLAPAQYLEDRGADPARVVMAKTRETESRGALHSALRNLDDRSQDIITQRWLLDQKSTLHELADKYGVSAERIRQLEKNAMKKIRDAMGEEFLEA